ncbi:single-stranded DNA-binding protein [Parasediminibacterium sp. JCM 36343]|uniref:single-stranded DNA-binding protein n=1 Tax=Parasediminibacterium sp. JCM 36343 TaxID=3374279 RepID=UPI00397B8FA4
MLKLLAIGHLGKDAVVNNVNGKSVINFNVAHSEKYKDAQGTQIDKTTWVSCAYWTDRTAIAPYLKKGTQVYVEGIPEVRTYTTNDGRHDAVISMRIMNIQLLGAKNADGSDNQGGGYTAQPQQQAAAPIYQPQPQAYRQEVSSPAPAAITEPLDDLPF